MLGWKLFEGNKIIGKLRVMYKNTDKDMKSLENFVSLYQTYNDISWYNMTRYFKQHRKVDGKTSI